jgi:hypothetical protein
MCLDTSILASSNMNRREYFIMYDSMEHEAVDTLMLGDWVLRRLEPGNTRGVGAPPL